MKNLLRQHNVGGNGYCMLFIGSMQICNTRILWSNQFQMDLKSPISFSLNILFNIEMCQITSKVGYKQHLQSSYPVLFKTIKC